MAIQAMIDVAKSNAFNAFFLVSLAQVRPNI